MHAFARTHPYPYYDRQQHPSLAGAAADAGKQEGPSGLLLLFGAKRRRQQQRRFGSSLTYSGFGARGFPPLPHPARLAGGFRPHLGARTALAWSPTTSSGAPRRLRAAGSARLVRLLPLLLTERDARGSYYLHRVPRGTHTHTHTHKQDQEQHTATTTTTTASPSSPSSTSTHGQGRQAQEAADERGGNGMWGSTSEREGRAWAVPSSTHRV